VFEVQYTDVEGRFWMPQCSEGNVAVGFSGPRNYSGDLLRQVLVFCTNSKIVNAFEAGDRKRLQF
jgi:hypothetical protein